MKYQVQYKVIDSPIPGSLVEINNRVYLVVTVGVRIANALALEKETVLVDIENGDLISKELSKVHYTMLKLQTPLILSPV